MKLNFWQWLGVLLLLVGVIIYVIDKGRAGHQQPTSTTQPGY